MASGNKKLILALLGALVCAGPALLPADAAAQSRVRIKDIADFEGVRQNMLVGYGLVIGLNGTGDTIANAPFTQQSIIGMLERMGVNTRDISSTLRTPGASTATGFSMKMCLPAFTAASK
jgi:flagellar P-ring protein precursor FlgI